MGPAVQHLAASPTPVLVSAENSATPTSASSVVISPSASCAAASASRASLAVELVGLGQQHQQLDRAVADARRDEGEQLAVEVGEAQARIDHQHHAGQAAPDLEVVGHHLLPAQLGAARDRRVAVARQVGEQRVGRVLRAQLEQVDVLRAARRLRREGEPLLLRQRVDRGRLAGVGAADEGDLGQLGGGQLVELAGGREEARGVGPGERLSRFGGGARAVVAGGLESVMEAPKAVIVKSPGFAPKKPTTPT